MFSWLDPHSTPIIVAHRGLSAEAPENTLAAFGLAITRGADAIEFDVRMTGDGEVVVFHDATLERTTDGTGRLRRKTFEELREYSAGKWFHPRFARERVPLLSEVIELVDRRVGMNIEIKDSPRASRHDIVEACLKIVHSHRAQRSVLITSFFHQHVKRARQLEPHIAAGVLYHPVKNFRRTPAALVSAVGGEYFICSKSALRKKMIENVYEHGVKLGVYTINTKRALQRALRAGADLIISNDPAFIRSQLKESGIRKGSLYE